MVVLWVMLLNVAVLPPPPPPPPPPPVYDVVELDVFPMMMLIVPVA
jgi:hypothetical protein